MDDDKVEIQDFMKAYYEGCDYEGKAILENDARRYHNDWQHYQMTTHARQQAEHDALFGSRSKKIDPEIGFAPIKEKHQKDAYAKAQQHGYTGPEFPEQKKETHQQKSETAKSDNAQANNEQERFKAALQQMRAEKQTITRRPRH